jgi:undecaprenyl-diphosphatase
MTGDFDHSIIAFVRHLIGKAWLVDYAALSISDNHLLKGGVFFAVLWGFWFRASDTQAKTRTILIANLFASQFTIILNQVLKMAAPMRLRPYFASLPGVYFPFDIGIKSVSSFPSDHATLFFTLATGFWFVSRYIGIAAWFYATLVICLPRLILGMHYPSDLLAGAFIGGASAYLLNVSRIRETIARPVLHWMEKHPALFYAAFFLFSYQIATLFDDLRALGNALQVIAGLPRH